MRPERPSAATEKVVAMAAMAAVRRRRSCQQIPGPGEGKYKAVAGGPGNRTEGSKKSSAPALRCGGSLDVYLLHIFFFTATLFSHIKIK